MGENEYNILEEIRCEVSQTREDIKSSNQQFNDFRVEMKTDIVETKTNVKNISEKIEALDTRLETWTRDGCPVGKVRYSNLEKEIKIVREDVSKVKDVGKDARKKSILVAVGGGVGVSAIANLLFSFFKWFAGN